MSQKVAYVTGGMGGIGTAICQRLHKDGFKVIAGCGPTRDFEKWLGEQKALGFTFYASVDHLHFDLTSSTLVFVDIHLAYHDLVRGQTVALPAAGSYRDYTEDRQAKVADMTLHSPATKDWIAFADAWRAEYQPGMEEIRWLKPVRPDGPGRRNSAAFGGW